jgi:uncharacterized protein with GYD domain
MSRAMGHRRYVACRIERIRSVVPLRRTCGIRVTSATVLFGLYVVVVVLFAGDADVRFEFGIDVIVRGLETLAAPR